MIKILNLILLIAATASCKESATTSLQDDASATGQMYTISFRAGGIPFENGSVEGIEGTQGIHCNRTTLHDCQAKYPADSKVAFRIPTQITTVLGKLKYGGSIKCNDVVKKIAANGDFVRLPFAKLTRDYNCSFLFVPI